MRVKVFAPCLAVYGQSCQASLIPVGMQSLRSWWLTRTQNKRWIFLESQIPISFPCMQPYAKRWKYNLLIGLRVNLSRVGATNGGEDSFRWDGATRRPKTGT